MTRSSTDCPRLRPGQRYDLSEAEHRAAMLEYQRKFPDSHWGAKDGKRFGKDDLEPGELWPGDNRRQREATVPARAFTDVEHKATAASGVVSYKEVGQTEILSPYTELLQTVLELCATDLGIADVPRLRFYDDMEADSVDAGPCALQTTEAAAGVFTHRTREVWVKFDTKVSGSIDVRDLIHTVGHEMAHVWQYDHNSAGVYCDPRHAAEFETKAEEYGQAVLSWFAHCLAR